MRPSRVLLGFVIAWILLRGAIVATAWRGDPSAERRAEALRHFTEAEIASGRAYLRARTPVIAATGYVITLATLALALGGFFHRMHAGIARLAGGGYWRATLLFSAALSLALDALGLPFAAWRHAVERREGFATLGWGGFALLQAKSAFVSALLAVGAAFLVFGIVRRFPRRWPLLLPAAGALAAAALVVAAPYVVTPLFHTETPLPAGELRERVEAVAAKAGIPLAGVYVVDASRTSRHTNATFAGFGGQKRVVLYDTLVDGHPPAEVALVFAHEAGHWLHDHMTKGFALGALGSLALCLLLARLHPWAAADPALRLGPPDDPRNVPLLLVALWCGALFVAPLHAQASQYMERQADRAALDLTGDPAVYEAATRALAVSNRGEILPHPFRVFWVHSHPPPLERLAQADAWRRERAGDAGGPEGP